ncbi:MAG TPA: hypothetical protein VJJ80_02360 [Patescibacteria group bacterium]|nr:hypothetical protein [Patescibacteria group bacterium]
MTEKNTKTSFSIINKTVKFLIVIAFMALFAYLGYQGYLLYNFTPDVVKPEITIKDTAETKKVEATRNYTNPVSATESTGRPDPLVPYK